VDEDVEELKKREKVGHVKIEGGLLGEFITCLHGSYWSIRKIIEEFRKPHSDISARIVKRKVPEIAVKEKRPNDVKVCSLTHP
jgi:hypothetical protein